VSLQVVKVSSLGSLVWGSPATASSGLIWRSSVRGDRMLGYSLLLLGSTASAAPFFTFHEPRRTRRWQDIGPVERGNVDGSSSGILSTSFTSSIVASSLNRTASLSRFSSSQAAVLFVLPSSCHAGTFRCTSPSHDAVVIGGGRVLGRHPMQISSTIVPWSDLGSGRSPCAASYSYLRSKVKSDSRPGDGRTLIAGLEDWSN
jgi:hypothetical protein